MNLHAAKHTLVSSIVELNKIAGTIEYSGPFYGSLGLLDLADTIWFTGLGKSGLVAQRGASMMRTIGKPANFIHPVDGLHGDMGAIKRGDVIVALSHSGETTEVLEFLDWNLDVPVIGMCKLGTALAVKARYTLWVEAKESIPTVSCMMQNAWIDALVVALTGDVEQILQETHPGGDIGRRLREPDQGQPERTKDTYRPGISIQRYGEHGT